MLFHLLDAGERVDVLPGRAAIVTDNELADSIVIINESAVFGLVTFTEWAVVGIGEIPLFLFRC